MAKKNIGIALVATDARSTLERIVEYDATGIDAVWSTSVAGGGDALTMLIAAAGHTSQTLLGTSIAQIWTRHPVTMAQQVLIADGLAPGRFRLGIGTGHKQGMVDSLGAEFERPLGHLKEYLQITRTLFKDGSVDFEGEHYTARASIAGPADIPVMASALRPKSFEVCGEMSDGAISWLCPVKYIEEVAMPALELGAERAERDAPPLVVHVPVLVHEDRDEVYKAFAEQASFYLKSVFYPAMFEAAGFPNSSLTGWTRELMAAVVVTGDEKEVSAKLRAILDIGNVEILAMPVTGGLRGEPGKPLPLAGAPVDRTVALLAELAKSQGE
jgi:F420-dependent oxidoreductase-like protein